MCQSDLWTLFSCGIKGAADYPPLGSLHAPPDKLVIYGLLHVDPRTCCAALAGVEEHALVGLFHSHVHWDEGEFSYTSPTSLKRCSHLEAEEITVLCLACYYVAEVSSTNLIPDTRDETLLVHIKG